MNVGTFSNQIYIRLLVEYPQFTCQLIQHLIFSPSFTHIFTNFLLKYLFRVSVGAQCDEQCEHLQNGQLAIV